MSYPLGQPDQKKALAITMIRQMKPEIARALPRVGVTADRMERMVLSALSLKPELARCDQMSFIAAVMSCAQLGLEPNTRLGQAHFIPYGSKVELVIGYPGWIVLADRAGFTLSAGVVYENDEFRYPEFGDTTLRHMPQWKDGSRGKRLWAFATAHHKTQRGAPMLFRVLTPDEINDAKKASAAVKGNRKDSPWFGDEMGKPSLTDAMWRKTAILRLIKYLPVSAEDASRFSVAMGADENVIDITSFATETPQLPQPETTIDADTDELAAKLKEFAGGEKQ